MTFTTACMQQKGGLLRCSPQDIYLHKSFYGKE